MRHRQVGVDGETAVFLEDVASVAALGEQFDRLAVVGYEADRAGARLGGAQAFREDCVEDLLRRQRAGEGLGDSLEPVRPVVRVGELLERKAFRVDALGHVRSSGPCVISRRSCSRSPRSSRVSTLSITRPISTGSNGLTT